MFGGLGSRRRGSKTAPHVTGEGGESANKATPEARPPLEQISEKGEYTVQMPAEETTSPTDAKAKPPEKQSVAPPPERKPREGKATGSESPSAKSPQWKGMNWLRDKKTMELDFSDARILQFNYPSTWQNLKGSKQTLDSIANELLGHLATVREAEPLRPIVFIGHGFGGTVIEKALVAASTPSPPDPVLPATAGVLLLMPLDPDRPDGLVIDPTADLDTTAVLLSKLIGKSSDQEHPRHDSFPLPSQISDHLTQLEIDFGNVADAKSFPVVSLSNRSAEVPRSTWKYEVRLHPRHVKCLIQYCLSRRL